MASSPGTDRATAIDLPYRVRIDAEGDGAVVATVVEALAAVRGVDPTDVDVPLNEYVDADAMERLYRHARGAPDGDVGIQFTAGEFVVDVRSDGLVTIA